MAYCAKSWSVQLPGKGWKIPDLAEKASMPVRVALGRSPRAGVGGSPWGKSAVLCYFSNFVEPMAWVVIVYVLQCVVSCHLEKRRDRTLMSCMHLWLERSCRAPLCFLSRKPITSWMDLSQECGSVFQGCMTVCVCVLSLRTSAVSLL